MPINFRNMSFYGYVDIINMVCELVCYGKADFRVVNLDKCRTSPVLPYGKNQTVTSNTCAEEQDYKVGIMFAYVLICRLS